MLRRVAYMILYCTSHPCLAATNAVLCHHFTQKYASFIVNVAVIPPLFFSHRPGDYLVAVLVVG